MTWLERLSNGVKLKAAVVIIIACIISVNILIAASAYYNYLQHRVAISDFILQATIVFYTNIASFALGFLFRGEQKEDK